jgi:hypothetical protein
MKNVVFLGVCLLFAASAFGQDAETVDFMRSLNEGLNQGNFFKTAMDIGGIPFLPGLYLSRKQSTYVTFGIMVNNTDNETQNPLLSDVLQTATLLKAAFLVRRNKTNVILFFDYYKTGQWGLSLRLKY